MRTEVRGSGPAKLHYCRYLMESNEKLVVVCSSEEMMRFAETRVPFSYVSGRALRVLVNGEEAPEVGFDIADARGPKNFAECVYEAETREVYWRVGAYGVLGDLFECAAYRAANGPGFLDLGARIAMLYRELVSENKEVFRRVPERYARNIEAYVLNNAPNTASCVLSCIADSVSFLEESRSEKSADTKTVFIAEDTMRSASASKYANLYARALGYRVALLKPVSLLPDVAHGAMFAYDEYVDRTDAPRTRVFLCGSNYGDLVNESNAHLTRRLRVETPERLSYDEFIMEKNGNFSYGRMEIDISIPATVEIIEENAAEDWLDAYREPAAEPVLESESEPKPEIESSESAEPDTPANEESDEPDYRVYEQEAKEYDEAVPESDFYEEYDDPEDESSEEYREKVIRFMKTLREDVERRRRIRKRPPSDDGELPF